MVGAWPFRPYTFRALTKTFRPLWVRCDVCRRYARLPAAGELLEVDYRSKTFSCSVCGGPPWLCVVEPITETGMADYRLDERERPTPTTPRSVDRLTGQGKRRRIDFSGRGEQPGRKIDPRR
jgi:hypothetical protein